MALKGPIIRLQIDIPSKESLDDFCQRRGLTQIAVASRLLTWFVRQDEAVQAAILSLPAPTAISGLSETLLKRIIGASKSPSSD